MLAQHALVPQFSCLYSREPAQGGPSPEPCSQIAAVTTQETLFVLYIWTKEQAKRQALLLQKSLLPLRPRYVFYLPDPGFSRLVKLVEA